MASFTMESPSWTYIDRRKYFTLGTCLNLLANTILYPIRVMKTLSQLQGSHLAEGHTQHSSGPQTTSWKGILRTEGPKGFFQPPARDLSPTN